MFEWLHNLFCDKAKEIEAPTDNTEYDLVGEYNKLYAELYNYDEAVLCRKYTKRAQIDRCKFILKSLVVKNLFNGNRMDAVNQWMELIAWGIYPQYQKYLQTVKKYEELSFKYEKLLWNNHKVKCRRLFDLYDYGNLTDQVKNPNTVFTAEKIDE